MNRKLVVVLVTFLTFGSLAAHDPVRQISRFLHLDAEQTQLVREILQNRRAEVRPLAEALRLLKAERKALLQSGDPANYPALGETVATIYDLSGQIKAIERQSRADFKALLLLNEDQLRKFRQIQRGARVDEQIPPFEDLKLLSGGRR